jgi:heptosyltransferase III
MQRGKALNRILDFYLGIPLLNLLACMRAKGKFPEHAGRIGILLNPALGDTLLASAPIQDIRALFPEATLILFAATSNLAAAKLLPAIDSIEILPISRPLKSIRILRGNKLDLMLDFTAWQRITAIYTLLSGARYKVGFYREGQYRHRGYDVAFPHRGDCHELDNIRRFTRSLGYRSMHPPRLLVSGGPLPQAMPRGRQIIVLHPWASGAQRQMREWPEEKWAGLARELAASRRIFLVTGSPADEARSNALCRRLVQQGIAASVLIGRDGLDDIARVLTQAELLVSVNTGIMHLGAILGVPTVSINGPTSSRRWGPVGPRVANVCPSDGSGEFLDLGFEFRNGCNNTMSKIQVAEVLSAVHSLFGGKENCNETMNSHVKWMTQHLSATEADRFSDRALPLKPGRSA